MRIGGKHLCPLGLDLPDHLHGQHKPAPQTIELGPEMRGQRAPVAGSERGEVALPRTQRGSLPDALGRQQSLDPVLEAHPLLHQVLALAMRALGILLIRRRHPDHAADLPVAPEIGHQHTQQALSVEPIGLGPPRAAVDQNAGRLQHVAGDAVGHEQPVQPEAVTPGLEAAGYLDRRSKACRDARPQRRGKAEQRRHIAGLDPVQLRPIGSGQMRGDQPHCAAELDRKIDNATMIGSLGGHAWLLCERSDTRLSPRSPPS